VFGIGRNPKIELTDAEKELFLGNELLMNKLKGNDSLHSSQGTPTNSHNLGNRRKRR
jgi:hypothetical protein